MSFLLKHRCWIAALSAGAALLCCAPAPLLGGDSNRELAIATVHPIATDAAVSAFRDGGNAVDAAVAAALTLGVVDAHNSGIGGGCLILVRSPNGELIAIDGRDAAPAAAHKKMYLRNGKAESQLSQTGALAVATPGAVAAYSKLTSKCGRLPLSRLLRPGMIAAEQGFRIDANLASSLSKQKQALGRFPGAKKAFLRPSGAAPAEGERLIQPDLARTYRSIGQHGAAWFYEGEFAERVGDWMAEHGGILTAADFAAYRAKQREPVITSYRGRTVVGFPPPSSGGVHVAQILNILENFDVEEVYSQNAANGVCLVAEAMKLAFADRAYWLGDSDYVSVPRGLISKQYARELAARISPARSSAVGSHGSPPAWRQDVFGRHTTHIAAADSEGFWVAITATINTSFGSKVVVPGTGVVLNNMMDDFAIHPGTPNAFGLLGAEYNAVQGGKRPLSSMSPTILLDEQKEPIMALGCAGGPKIITQVLSAIVNTIDRRMSPADALKQPRFHHQWAPDLLRVSPAMPVGVNQALRDKGHKVQVFDTMGVVQIVARDTRGGFVAVHDPVVKGKAVVFEP